MAAAAPLGLAREHLLDGLVPLVLLDVLHDHLLARPPLALRRMPGLGPLQQPLQPLPVRGP